MCGSNVIKFHERKLKNNTRTATHKGAVFLRKIMSMRLSPEIPITMREPFAIKPANIDEPIRSLVTGIKESGDFQRVSLVAIDPPKLGYEMSTGRLISPGVYTSRDEKFIFLRLLALNLEDLSRHFPQISPRRLIRMLINDVKVTSPIITTVQETNWKDGK